MQVSLFSFSSDGIVFDFLGEYINVIVIPSRREIWLSEGLSSTSSLSPIRLKSTIEPWGKPTIGTPNSAITYAGRYRSKQQQLSPSCRWRAQQARLPVSIRLDASEHLVDVPQPVVLRQQSSNLEDLLALPGCYVDDSLLLFYLEASLISIGRQQKDNHNFLGQ